jgi:protoheme IX farnesyltransferase
MLFAMQFLWQMPHFWAVAWLADEDYKRAGFYLLPSKSGERDSSVGAISALFCGALVLLSLWVCWIGLVGVWATGVLVVLNLYWASLCWKLAKEQSREAARKQMFASFLHLPVTLIVLLLDKIF